MESVSINIDVKIEELRNLLVCAFEGGSNYWYYIKEYILPEGTIKEDFDEGGKYEVKAKYHSWGTTYVLPFVENGGLVILDAEDDNKEYKLNLKAIKKGIKVMAEKYPHHFADILNENTDATTGDVFLQCCVFGDVVYE